MTVYIDNWFGEPLLGYTMNACVMYSEIDDLKELRRIAKEVGLRKIMERNYEDKVFFYYVSESKRDGVINEGVIEIEASIRIKYFKNIIKEIMLTQETLEKALMKKINGSKKEVVKIRKSQYQLIDRFANDSSYSNHHEKQLKHNFIKEIEGDFFIVKPLECFDVINTWLNEYTVVHTSISNYAIPIGSYAKSRFLTLRNRIIKKL